MNYKLETNCLCLTGMLLDMFGTGSRNHRLGSLGCNKPVLNGSEEAKGTWKGILMLDMSGEFPSDVADLGFLDLCCCAELM